MDKFRVISDLHLDLRTNSECPVKINDDVFTVIAGDTSGYVSQSIEWIRQNIRRGVGVSGNHLVYNDDMKPIQELRDMLASEFPAEGDFTYLDCETGTFCKEVDGILFIGTCMYTNMRISHPVWNPTGDKDLNAKCSLYNMNDYRFGIKRLECGSGTGPTAVKISPDDYSNWFINAYNKIEKTLNENEASAAVRPVVLITHHPIVTDFLEHSSYIDNYITSQKEFNWASYASDMRKWLMRHTSVKCYCCGHIHGVSKEYRHFYIERADRSRILVVNNARGYLKDFHDINFNVNLFVNVKDWTVESLPPGEAELKRKKDRTDRLLRDMAWLI